jgi:hypothetical protein
VFYKANVDSADIEAIGAFMSKHNCELLRPGSPYRLVERGALVTRILVNSTEMYARSIDLSVTDAPTLARPAPAQSAHDWTKAADGSSCPRIPADDLVEAFTLHGFRYGGPNGPLVQADAVWSMHPSGDGLTEPGHCLAQLGISANGDLLPALDVEVDRMPDGSLRITPTGHFAN